jgi:hypothetical protein
VPLAQQRRDPGVGRVHIGCRIDADADRAHAVAADEELLHGGHRDEDLVVRVLEPAPALRLEDADDREADATDGDLGADRVLAETKVVGDRLAEHGHA